MTSWTAHLKPGRDPVLMKDAYAPGATLFGPLWFLANRAWIPAVLQGALLVLAAVLLPAPYARIVAAALAILAGLLGRDLVRWSLERRGYTLAHVLVARDEEGALSRLLTYRPDVAASVAARLS